MLFFCAVACALITAADKSDMPAETLGNDLLSFCSVCRHSFVTAVVAEHGPFSSTAPLYGERRKQEFVINLRPYTSKEQIQIKNNGLY
jgi:hypothetical protein